MNSLTHLHYQMFVSTDAWSQRPECYHMHTQKGLKPYSSFLKVTLKVNSIIACPTNISLIKVFSAYSLLFSQVSPGNLWVLLNSSCYRLIIQDTFLLYLEIIQMCLFKWHDWKRSSNTTTGFVIKSLTKQTIDLIWYKSPSDKNWYLTQKIYQSFAKT